VDGLTDGVSPPSGSVLYSACRLIEDTLAGQIIVSGCSPDGLFGASDEAIGCATEALFGSPSPCLIGSILDGVRSGLVLQVWFVEKNDGDCGSKGHSAENPVNRFHYLTSSGLDAGLGFGVDARYGLSK
jgi:hypothetical protein